MKVRDCMTKNVVCVGAQEPVSVAARLMYRYNLGALPVQGADGRLAGVLTDRDVVLRCVAPERQAGQLRVKDIMSAGVVSVRPDEQVAQAASLMAARQLRRLPVAQDGRLVGIVSHVAELRDRIGRQIIVKNLPEGGSAARLVIEE